MRLELNFVYPLTKPLNRKLVEQTSREIGLLPITKVNGDGNPTCQNGDPMKWVHMGNNKSFVDCEVVHHLYFLRVHPYGVDKAYSVLIKVECKLLMNTIFLWDGVFRCRTHFMGSTI